MDNTGKGDLAEVAFLKTAARNKIYKSILDGKYPRVFEVPMDSDKRILTTVNNYKIIRPLISVTKDDILNGKRDFRF